jgi:hypothetical protein
VYQLDDLIDLLSQFLQDTTGGVFNFFKSFEGWKSYYRFTNAVNSQYTILSRDTTFTFDTLSLPLRFQILGKRFNDQQIITDLGAFNCKKFTIERRISYLIQFPPPIPPMPVKILGFIDTLWIAPNNWIVKTFAPSTLVDLSILGLPSTTIPGYKLDIQNPIITVEDEISFVSNFELYQNYPNPFNPKTKIKFSLSNHGEVKLTIFNILGKEITTLIDEFKSAGQYEIEFDASTLPSGVYIYKLKSGEQFKIKKMTILK